MEAESEEYNGFFAGCSRQLDIVFGLDLSGSQDTVYYMSLNFTRQVRVCGCVWMCECRVQGWS